MCVSCRAEAKLANPLGPCLCSGQASACLALRSAHSRSHLVCWLPGQGVWHWVSPMSSSPGAADVTGWASTRVPEFSLSKGCPGEAGRPDRRLVCEHTGWLTSLGRSGGKPPWWHRLGAMQDMQNGALLHVLEDGQGGFNMTVPHQGFRLPRSSSTAEVKG